MANIAYFNVYQTNSLAPYPLSQVVSQGFSTSNFATVRSIPASLALLSTGVYCYSAIQLLNGAQYYVVENQAAIVTAFG